jgi:hypothetical protein
MLEIQLGDRNPKVVLLQILLNRRGSALRVDGVFGPRTREAVVAFQRGSSPPRPGSVDPQTFNTLFADSRLSIIDVVDAGDPMVPRTAGAVLVSTGANPPIELGLMCNGVGQMITDVIGRAANPIALLRITGHGNLGRWMTVSVGSVAHLQGQPYSDAESEYFSYIDLRHFEQLRQVLSRLTSHFARFGSMEHHGCSIGSVADSRRMMQKLSDVWRVPVSAGTGLQTASGIPRFNGPVHTAFPNNGNLSSWSEQFRNISL